MNGAVAALVAVGSTQEDNVDREALVQQALLALDVDQLNQIFLGYVVQLAAAVARVSEGVQTNVGDGADVVCSDVAVHMGDNALRQVVCLNLILKSKLAESRSTVPVAADNALYHALVSKVVAAGARGSAVALTCCVEQGHVLRMTGFNKALLQSLGQGLRASAAYEAAGCDGVAIVDQQSSFLSRNNLDFLHWNLPFTIDALSIKKRSGRCRSSVVYFCYLFRRYQCADRICSLSDLILRHAEHPVIRINLLVEVRAGSTAADNQQDIIVHAVLRKRKGCDIVHRTGDFPIGGTSVVAGIASAAEFNSTRQHSVFPFDRTKTDR